MEGQKMCSQKECPSLSPSKELPTKMQKSQRAKDRRGMLPHREWDCNSSYQLSTKFPKSLETELGYSSDSTRSSTPVGCFLGQTESNISCCPLHQCQTMNPTYISNNMNCLEQVAKETCKTKGNESDEPLDMSIRSSRQTLLSTKKLQHQSRPSVITCALREQFHTKCKTNSWHYIKGHDNKVDSNFNIKDYSGKCNLSSENEPGYRTETTSGFCDPVIEEHFRRSLGIKYQQLFSPSTAGVSISVDDHFAKALGDTWLLLQKTMPNWNESRTSSSPPATSYHPQAVVSS